MKVVEDWVAIDSGTPFDSNAQKVESWTGTLKAKFPVVEFCANATEDLGALMVPNPAVQLWGGLKFVYHMTQVSTSSGSDQVMQRLQILERVQVQQERKIAELERENAQLRARKSQSVFERWLKG